MFEFDITNHNYPSTLQILLNLIHYTDTADYVMKLKN